MGGGDDEAVRVSAVTISGGGEGLPTTRRRAFAAKLIDEAEVLPVFCAAPLAQRRHKGQERAAVGCSPVEAGGLRGT